MFVMSVSYSIDLKQQVVYTQVVGVIDGPQLYEHQVRLGSDPDFHSEMRELMDCIDFKNAKLTTILNSYLVKSSPWKSSARRAIVVSGSLAFGFLSVFQKLMSNAHGDISIFRDMESAKEWLDL